MKYELKPLEWKHSDPGYAEMNPGSRWASAGIEPFNFNIWGEEDGTARFTYCIDEYYNEGTATFDSWDEAVAAAVAWYTDQVTSYLNPATENAQ